MIKQATFTSVWDGGNEITTDCLVDTESKEVFSIATVDESDCEILDKEYITIDGKDFPVFQVSDITEEDNKYWYD